MAYEALYRRYRPRRFAEVKGQEHVVAALANAVANDRVGHAYLFSGPRGTGKTSSARLLAKSLNCTNRTGGEPCDECEACTNFNNGSSYDLRELDAASNNGVEAMRDLISKVGLSAGGHGVFILDEVHMLSSGAENALLKTLEEPPPGVTFVLCTTEPNKVVPTIRSRTQHLEFNLLPAEQLVEHVKYVAADAGLEITDADIDFVVRAGAGSARDTLSALDQVVAAGGAPEHFDKIGVIINALAARDTGAALVAVNEATRMGRDPEVIGREILADLRSAFLATMGASLAHLDDNSQTVAAERASQFGPAALTRGMETLGSAIVEMRQAPDPRVDLELALVRLTRPELDSDPAALLARIEQLERNGPPVGGTAPIAPAAPSTAVGEAAMGEAAVAEAAAPPQQAAPAAPVVEPAAAPPPQSAPAETPAPAPQRGGRPADVARAALAKKTGSTRAAPPAAETRSPPPAAAAAPAPEAPPTMREKPTLGSVRRAQGAATPTPAASPAAEPPIDDAPHPADTAPVNQAPPAADPAPAPPVNPAPSAADPAPGPPANPAPPAADPAPGPPANPAPPAADPAPAPPANPAPPAADPAPAPPVNQAPPAADPAPAPSADAPSVDVVAAAWSEHVLGTLPPPVKARFSAGQFLAPADGATLRFALPNEVHRQRCDEVRSDVDTALATHFGQPVPLELVVGDPDAPDAPAGTPAGDDGSTASTADRPEEEIIDVHDLTDASEMNATGIERLAEAFPGAELVEDES